MSDETPKSIVFKGATYVKADAESMLDYLIKPSDIYDVEEALDSGRDQQLSHMLSSAVVELRKRFQLDSSTHDALRRVLFVMKHHKTADPALLRNNLGKALAALKLKTPIFF